MNIGRWSIAVIATIVLLFAGCGGGGGGSSSNDTSSGVEIDLDGLNIRTEELMVVTGNNVSPIDDVSTVTLTKEEKTVVGVYRNFQPILMGRKVAGQERAEVSLTSSAETYVLFHPRFNDVVSKDPLELSRRIRNHPRFGELKGLLKKEIESGNPCPMNPQCSPVVRDLAIVIADELQLDDLY